MSEIISELNSRLVKRFQEQKSDYVKQKFTEKGFGHLIPDSPVMFPRIALLIIDGVEYYFADDGSKYGYFVVGIRNSEPNYPDWSFEDRSVEIKLSFTSFDTIPHGFFNDIILPQYLTK